MTPDDRARTEAERVERNPYLPEPPADGKHVFNGGYRCVRCGVYNRDQAENPPFYEPCEGEWKQSGKMRAAADDRWAAERADAGLLATQAAQPEDVTLSEVERIAVLDAAREVFACRNPECGDMRGGDAIERAVKSILAARQADRDRALAEARAEVLREAADEMAAVITDGDVAEVAAPVPGEVGRAAAIDRRDALYNDPHAWLLDRADRLDQGGDNGGGA